MMKRLALAVLCLATLALAVHSEDAPASEFPFKLEAKGETLEAISFKASAVRALKQATPREVAGEFAQVFFQDNESEQNRALKEKCDVLIAEFMHRMRCLVMDEALVNKLEAGDKAAKEKQAAENKGGSMRKTRTPTVTGEEKQADGKVLVMLEQVTETTSTDSAGKSRTETSVAQQRLLCAKVGEIWAVEKHEALQADWSEKGKESAKKWTEQETLKQWFLFGASFPEPDFKLETGTAEATARTVLTQTGGFGAEFALYFFLVGRMAPAVLEVVKPMFTPESWKNAEAAAKAEVEKKQKEKGDGKEPERKARAVEKHETPEKGLETFLFEPENNWAGKHWVKMKQTDKGWRCIEIKKFARKQVFDKEGNMTETWEEKPVEKFSDLDW